MAVHHHLLHHLHDHHLHLLLLIESFTLNLRLGSSANHFLHTVAALRQGAPGQMTWLEDLPPWLMTWLENLRCFGKSVNRK